MNKIKRFDCVKMVRNIREEFYEKHKDKSIDEMFDIIIDDAKKSPLWKKLKRVRPYLTVNPLDQSLKIADKND